MEYMTITEYAAAAHISKTAAYNRAKNAKYKGYFRRMNGVLCVDSSILEFNQFNNGDSTAESVDTQAAAGKSFNGDSTEFSTIEQTLLSVLQEQLKRQSEQIESLYSMIAEKDGIIKDLSANMAQITAQIQALQHEQNLLEAGRIEAEPRPPAENIPTETTKTAETIKTEPRKRGLFSRFRR